MVCRKSPMVALPLCSNCSCVTTVTGAGVVRSLRRRREPVTTISSPMCSRDEASLGTGTSAAGCSPAGCATGWLVLSGVPGAGDDIACANAELAMVEMSKEKRNPNLEIFTRHRARRERATDQVRA
jgi:hypothetical protein